MLAASRKLGRAHALARCFTTLASMCRTQPWHFQATTSKNWGPTTTVIRARDRSRARCATCRSLMPGCFEPDGVLGLCRL